MYAVALFDIDGTLCDPGDGITAAVQYALGRFGVREDDDAALRRFIGPPLEHAFRDYYGLDDAQVRAAVGHYREHYRAEGLGRYRAYPGAAGLLADLAAVGVVLGVVTAKSQYFAQEALRGTGLLPWFRSVHGRGVDEVVTKDVTLGQALAGFDQRRRDIVMIGDREHDVLAARHHGLDSIGVLHGYGTRAELVTAGATHLAVSVAEIRPLVVAGPG